MASPAVEFAERVDASCSANKQEEIDPEFILDTVESCANTRGSLIATLEEIQAEYGYLPEEALRIVAKAKGIPLVDVYGVATFYKTFSLVPKGEHIVCCCSGTACHVRGAPLVLDEFERQLGIKVGETTEDRKFSLDSVNCLGACALGPIVLVDNQYFSKVNVSKVKEILQQVGNEQSDSELS